MKKPQDRFARRMVLGAAVSFAAFAIVLQEPVRADKNGPTVPAAIRVEPGNRVFLSAHAIGTQNYMCLPSGATVAWTPIGPQATLFRDNDRQITTHFLSVNPLETATARPTWQHSRDTSAVWALPIASSTDPAFVAPGAIPWLLLRMVGTAEGPGGGDTLTKTTFIQRINTLGGTAPATGCSLVGDIGKREFVYYEADYVFYREKDDDN